MGLLYWLKRLFAEPQLDAEILFKEALSQLDAGNQPEALQGFSRVLQLVPDHGEALARRERLAIALGLEDLDRAARLLEQFAYSQCGAGHGWKVELREMYAFRPHQTPEPYDAALLDFCQTPRAFIELRVRAKEYQVRLMAERPVPGVSRTCVSEVTSQNIPAQATGLIKLLNQFVKTGVLAKDSKTWIRREFRRLL